MLTKRNLLFVVATAAAALPIAIRDDASTILSDLHALDASVQSLTSTISAYSGGVAGSLGIAPAIAAVHLANRKTYVDAIGLPARLGAADSQSIVNYVTSPIAVDIPNSVSVTESKKSLFKAAGLDLTIEAGLILLKADHDSLSAVLEEKLANVTLAQGQAAVTAIDLALQNGIYDFSS